jgi:ADP-ribosylarginine hydrolase
MVKINEKIEASLMFSSYFETLGFKNGHWEFNYSIPVKSLSTYINVFAFMIQNYTVLGGSHHINLTDWNASDDTIMIIATCEAIIKGGGESNYIEAYLKWFDFLVDAKRFSGKNTLESLKLLKRGITLKTLPIKTEMGGNGASMRTGPIGIIWYKNIEKVIEESICASRLTHNYYIGFLGGMVTALFTAFAMNNIPAYEWCEELIKLYNTKKIEKYYPLDHNLENLDDFMGYWKRYHETRINKIKYKNTLDNFIFPDHRATFLIGFFPNPQIKNMVLKGESFKKFEWTWDKLGGSGLDSCIYAYDCLLCSMTSPGSKTLDFDNIQYNWDTFMTLVSIHPGDSDSTAAIGGTWFGALNGFSDFNINRFKELEFYKEIKKVSDQLIK